MLHAPNHFITIVLKLSNIIFICDEKGRAWPQKRILGLIAKKGECAEILHDLTSTNVLRKERY